MRLFRLCRHPFAVLHIRLCGSAAREQCELPFARQVRATVADMADGHMCPIGIHAQQCHHHSHVRAATAPLRQCRCFYKLRVRLAYCFLQRDLRREKRQHARNPGRDDIHRHPRGLATSGGVACRICNHQEITELRARVMHYPLIFFAHSSAIGLACNAGSYQIRNFCDIHKENLQSPGLLLSLLTHSSDRSSDFASTTWKDYLATAPLFSERNTKNRQLFGSLARSVGNLLSFLKLRHHTAVSNERLCRIESSSYISICFEFASFTPILPVLSMPDRFPQVVPRGRRTGLRQRFTPQFLSRMDSS